jgi:uncharacterized protein (TIGR03435 family)
MFGMKLLCIVLLMSMLQQFEVASIKRNVSDGVRVRFETPPGRLNAINAPLRFIIRQAYRVPESRIIGGPSWVDTDRFDILATTSQPANGDASRAMLRALLKERFELALHTETREMPIYVLKRRSGDTLGPNMRPVNTDCTGRSPAMVAGKVQCGILVSPGSASASMRGGGATIEQFARLLGDFLDRPLIDETGLTGTFDLELEFAAAPGSGVAPSASIDDKPSLFTAIQEQLGLKLDAQRGRAEVWIIDGASPPRQD